MNQPKNIPSRPPKRAITPDINGYVKEIEEQCQDCGGSGYDSSSLDPFGDICKSCMGSGRETVIRNYLAEAFQIAANANSSRPVERDHLIAIVQYCRDTVNALCSPSPAAKRDRDASDSGSKLNSLRPRRRRHARRNYGEDPASREKVITNRKGERIYATFSPQRT